MPGKTKSLESLPSPVRRQVKKKLPETDWAKIAAMTDEDVVAAALTDPDNLPWTEEQLLRTKRRPRVFVIRRALKLSQEQFAVRFQIPIGTLRDWEQGRTEPDQAAQAYLKVIAFDARFVERALSGVGPNAGER